MKYLLDTNVCVRISALIAGRIRAQLANLGTLHVRAISFFRHPPRTEVLG